MVLLTLVAAHVYFICPHIHWEPACEATNKVSYFTDPRQKKTKDAGKQQERGNVAGPICQGCTNLAPSGPDG